MQREIHHFLKNMIIDPERHEVIIIEGARQVGKSWLVNDVLDDIGGKSFRFDLEKNNQLRHEINRTEDFPDFQALMTDSHDVQPGSILFFDEAQECPNLARYVKSFKEDWPEVRVILTGSSMNRFFPKSVRIPVGRTRSLCVFGFSFSEFVRFIKGDSLADFILSAPTTIPPSRHQLLLKLFDDYLVIGGYPEAVKAFKSNQSPSGIIEEIVALLEEDFERKEEFQPGLFRNILQATANHVGSPSKLTQIDATKYHAKAAIEAMRSWHIILEMPMHALDPNHSRFLPKRYLHDTGVLNIYRTLAAPAISMIDTIDPVLRTPLGGLFENAVLINLLSGESAFKTISGWKKKSQSSEEVDFIIEGPNSRNKIPAECKAATKISKTHFKNVRRYLELTKQDFGFLISAAPFKKIRLQESGTTILNLPVYLANKSNIQQYLRRHSEE
jgi:uncharacterized protein